MYNEEDSVRPLVRALTDKLSAISEDYEIIIVDDGSLDSSGKIADKLSGEDPRIKVVHHGKNLGYGAAIRSGIAASRYDYIFYTDGDIQFDAEEIDKLLPFIGDHEIVTGYRIKKQQYGIKRIIITSIRNLFDRIIFGLPYKDLGCAFKIFKREIFNEINLTLNGMMIETEIFLKAKKKGFKIKEVGITNYPRAYGRGTGSSLKMILQALFELWKLFFVLISK